MGEKILITYIWPLWSPILHHTRLFIKRFCCKYISSISDAIAQCFLCKYNFKTLQVWLQRVHTFILYNFQLKLTYTNTISTTFFDSKRTYTYLTENFYQNEFENVFPEEGMTCRFVPVSKCSHSKLSVTSGIKQTCLQLSAYIIGKYIGILQSLCRYEMRSECCMINS